MEIEETAEEARKAALIQRMLDVGNDDEEPEEEVVAMKALQSGKSESHARSGRRKRDARGCVVHKPHDSANARQTEISDVPGRDARGYRLDKPFDPRR